MSSSRVEALRADLRSATDGQLVQCIQAIQQERQARKTSYANRCAILRSDEPEVSSCDREEPAAAGDIDIGRRIAEQLKSMYAVRQEASERAAARVEAQDLLAKGIEYLESTLHLDLMVDTRHPVPEEGRAAYNKQAKELLELLIGYVDYSMALYLLQQPDLSCKVGEKLVLCQSTKEINYADSIGHIKSALFLCARLSSQWQTVYAEAMYAKRIKEEQEWQQRKEAEATPHTCRCKAEAPVKKVARKVQTKKAPVKKVAKKVTKKATKKVAKKAVRKVAGRR